MLWPMIAYGECHYGERKADQLLNEMAERGVPIIAAKINRNARDSRTRPRGWPLSDRSTSPVALAFLRSP